MPGPLLPIRQLVDRRPYHYASLLIGKGASVKVVQERLGHKSAVETLENYAHLWPDDEDLTRGAVDAVYRPAESTSAGEIGQSPLQ